ncbi:PIG-L family deacetylase [Myxococcota bacterium]|nr:PIG-L family deacetylase [Myxococcota bacterium]
MSPVPAAVSTEWLLRPAGSPLFIFAHQDDETVLAGIIQRVLGDDARGTFVWWTNGDGLAPGSGFTPAEYAKIRIAESAEALRRLGGSERRKVDLESSEIENYRRMTHVALGGRVRDDALRYFLDEAERVERAIRAADPDRVFLLAWQGGHPEHDLVHLMTRRAIEKLRRETGRPIPIVQCPAYEYVIACAMRFKPWFHGDVRHIMLTPGELERKRSVIDAYPSQRALIEKFRRVITVVGWAGVLRGGRVTDEQYLSKEELGVVDPALDYTRSTHRLDRMNYMLDDFEGTPIRFSTMIRPVAELLLSDVRTSERAAGARP